MTSVVKNNTSQKKKDIILKKLKRSWQWYILLLPALIHLIVFAYGPMYGLQIAFKNFRPSRGIWGSEWVGLKHFISFVKNPMFGRLLKNTLSITLYSLALFPIPVIFALFLNEIKNAKFKKTVQMLTYMPHFITEIVVCSIVILFLDRTSGPINRLIELVGGEAQNFMGMPNAFPSIMVWSGMWQGLGWSSILYISALAGISTELIEAARIDGASRFQIMWHVNIPGILPTILINFLLKVGGILGLGHTKILLLQNDLNLETSQVISTYIYEIGLKSAKFSYASAIGLFNTLVSICVLLFVNALTKKLTNVGLF